MKAKRKQTLFFLPKTAININSYAEMDKVEKNKISHRFKALEKLKMWLQDSS